MATNQTKTRPAKQGKKAVKAPQPLNRNERSALAKILAKARAFKAFYAAKGGKK